MDGVIDREPVQPEDLAEQDDLVGARAPHVEPVEVLAGDEPLEQLAIDPDVRGAGPIHQVCGHAGILAARPDAPGATLHP